MRRLSPLALALLLACSKGESLQPAPAPQAAAEPPAVSADATDAEPPDAQARAEAVVFADFNKDKTTMLTASMTTLVDKTSNISGFATALASSKEEKIEDKLSRLAAKETATEITIQLPGAILFDFASSQIRPDAERTLNDVVSVIRAYAGRPVRVEGHTDSIASDDYNQKLSEERAKSVTSWLASHGVEAGRLTGAGLGETKPVATNDTAAGRQQNRRVEIVIAKR